MKTAAEILFGVALGFATVIGIEWAMVTYWPKKPAFQQFFACEARKEGRYLEAEIVELTGVTKCMYIGRPEKHSRM